MKIILSILLTLTGGIMAYYLFLHLSLAMGNDSVGAVLVGLFIGVPLGSAVGMWISKRISRKHQTNGKTKYFRGIIVAVIGAFIGVIVFIERSGPEIGIYISIIITIFCFYYASEKDNLSKKM